MTANARRHTAAGTRTPADRRTLCLPGEAPLGSLVFAAPDWTWEPTLRHDDDHRFQAAYLSFLEQMLHSVPPEVTVVMVTHRRAENRCRDWTARRRAGSLRVLAVTDSCRFTVWARDIFLPTQGPEGLGALAPCQFPRANDERFAREVADGLGLRYERSPLFFQGGNVVADDTVVLVGADDHALTLGGLPEGQPRIGQLRYARTLACGRRCLVVRSRRRHCEQTLAPLPGREGWRERRHAGSPPRSRQPVFHLDMFLAPLGSGRIAVGDTAMARAALVDAMADDGTDAALDEVAALVAAAGYEVRRVPLPILPYDDTQARLRTWYFASPLNVIADPAASIVWLPRVARSPSDDALCSIDRRHEAMWQACGYRVVGLTGLVPILERLGGPRCLVQALPREPGARQLQACQTSAPS